MPYFLTAAGEMPARPPIAPRQHGQGRGIGFLIDERDLVGVEHRDVINRSQGKHERERPGVVERVIGIEYAVEVEFDRVGVELGSIVEFDAFAQRERVVLPSGETSQASARPGSTSRLPSL